MMAGKIELGQITNAVVYMDGKCKLGVVKDLDLGQIKLKQDTHEALGMLAELKLPAGIEALEGGIEWNSFNQDAWAKMLNFYGDVQLQVRGNQEYYAQGGRTRQVPYVVFLSARFTEVPLGKFAQNKKTEFPSKFGFSYIKQVVDGQDILEIDVLANVFKVGGKDITQEFLRNTGQI